MPVDQIVNPAGTESETPSNGSVVEYYQLNPSSDEILINGNLVSLVALTAPATGPVLIDLAETTPNQFMLGVVVDAPTGGYLPGSIVAVQVEGTALALFDENNTTAGHGGVQSSTTEGTLTDAAISETTVLGTVMCIILSSVTLGAVGLVPVYLHRM